MNNLPLWMLFVHIIQLVILKWRTWAQYLALQMQRFGENVSSRSVARVPMTLWRGTDAQDAEISQSRASLIESSTRVPGGETEKCVYVAAELKPEPGMMIQLKLQAFTNISCISDYKFCLHLVLDHKYRKLFALSCSDSTEFDCDGLNLGPIRALEHNCM